MGGGLGHPDFEIEEGGHKKIFFRPLGPSPRSASALDSETSTTTITRFSVLNLCLRVKQGQLGRKT